jgi:hypothetical protein
MTREDISFAFNYINEKYGKKYLKQFKNIKT